MTDNTSAPSLEQVEPETKPSCGSGAAASGDSSTFLDEKDPEQDATDDPAVPFEGKREEILDRRLGAIKLKDERFYLWMGPAKRKHNRRHIISLLVWTAESRIKPGYLERKLSSNNIAVASNAKNDDRAIYAAAIKLGSSYALREESGESMRPHDVSRTAHVMEGIAVFCRSSGISLAFGSEGIIYQETHKMSDQKLRDLANDAARVGSNGDEPGNEELGTMDVAPVDASVPAETELAGSGGCISAIPMEADRSGGTLTRHDGSDGKASSPRGGSEAETGTNMSGSADAQPLTLLVRECLPALGQLPKCSSGPGNSSDISLFVGLPAGNDSGTLLYGPIESGIRAEKAVRAMLPKHSPH
ncbi:hypothetical protein [Bradyrhizobium sp. P5_C11_2]